VGAVVGFRVVADGFPVGLLDGFPVGLLVGPLLASVGLPVGLPVLEPIGLELGLFVVPSVACASSSTIIIIACKMPVGTAGVCRVPADIPPLAES